AEDFVSRIFVANTHDPMLVFSSTGMVYKMKVWRIPEGAPASRGKAFVNLLPLEQGETITSILPLPEDESEWSELHVMFATKSGGVRRNRLSDFTQINRNGKIAMKLDEGDRIIGVSICREDDNVLLTTANGYCIRFPVSEVRVFSGRTSTGVRGVKLGTDKAFGEDAAIGMSILRSVDASPDEARAYLKHASAMRRAAGDDEDAAEADDAGAEETILSPERIAQLGAAEQFVLTVTENGYGKRTSAFEYRVSGRGGKGIIAITTTARNGRVVASFPVEDADQIMVVTDGGQLIRCPVDGIRIAGRNTQGVTILNTREDERVVSIEHLGDVAADDDAEDE
ncbi:MAG: DNA gyrase C-terminal beta-propeller domain-containing protein, partial [Pseudomonadota bacterium]